MAEIEIGLDEPLKLGDKLHYSSGRVRSVERGWGDTANQINEELLGLSGAIVRVTRNVPDDPKPRKRKKRVKSALAYIERFSEVSLLNGARYIAGRNLERLIDILNGEEVDEDGNPSV